MQCSAMPCHATLRTRFQPILEQARRWESKPEKNENRKGTRAAYCLLWPGEERRLRQSHPIPSIKRHPNRPSPRTRGKKRNRKSPDYEKLRQFSRSVPVIPLAQRENNQQVTSTIMSCLETTGSTAERLRTHAADTAAGLAHTGLALSAAPAGR